MWNGRKMPILSTTLIGHISGAHGLTVSTSCRTQARQVCDAAIQDSQGPIQDRTKEHLGPTDIGIVEFRKLVMGTARRLAAGEPPAAAHKAHRYNTRCRHAHLF